MRPGSGFRAVLTVLALASLLVGCERQQGSGILERSAANLVAVSGCDDLLVKLRQNALAEMNAALDRNLEHALQGGGYYYCGWEGLDFATDGRAVPGAAAPPSAGDSNSASQGPSEYSTTNNQVVGVDEADFIKNDSHFIYVLADGHLQIVRAWPPELAQVLATFPVEGTPLKLFVAENKALIYSSLGASDAWRPRECTYGYDCEFTGDGRPLKMTVVSLLDVFHPSLLREVYFSGSFLNARRVGPDVHTVVTFPPVQFPALRYWPEDSSGLLGGCGQPTPIDEARIRLAFDELRAQNARVIEEAALTDWLPAMRDVRYADGVAQTQEGLLAGCKGFWTSPVDDGQGLRTLVSVDLSQQHSPLALTTVVGRPGAVYAGAEALYVAPRHHARAGQPWFWDTSQGGPEEATAVHKFALGPGALTRYRGSGLVKGRVLNQFAMDEHQGHLRIATTTGRLPSPDVHSTVTVLRELAGSLVETGRLDHLAPTEDIRSARFDGERGYLVTFKKTDPLFVLDLADPAAPRVAGELKIPGFSTYMQRMGPNHLLAIGFDAEDHGSFAYFQGVQLQIFDVTDPARPALAHKTVIGTRGSSSEALTNHLGVNYFAPRNLLALPMTVCEASSGGSSYGDLMTFSGLMVYDVTVAAGFSYRGGIEHEEAETAGTWRGACATWWSDSTSGVKRSIVMDDYVFSVAEDVIKVDHLDALGGDPVAVVPLATP